MELGPGRGTLMADALRAAQAWRRNFCDELEVVLVEASPVLREMQQRKTERQRRARSAGPTHFDDSADDRPLFLIANEFFDALPIRQYVKTERGWCERMVVAKDGELDFALAPHATPPSADSAGARRRARRRRL